MSSKKKTQVRIRRQPIGTAISPITGKPTTSVRKSLAKAGNKSARDFGIYEHALIDEEEKDLFENLSLDSLDYEIKMLRIRLRRAQQADALQKKLLASGKNEEAMYMNKHVRSVTPDGLVVSKERVLKDYGRDCDVLEARLAHYIQLRNQILVGTANENDELARIEARRKAAFFLDRQFAVASDAEMADAKAEYEKIKKGGKP